MAFLFCTQKNICFSLCKNGNRIISDSVAHKDKGKDKGWNVSIKALLCNFLKSIKNRYLSKNTSSFESLWETFITLKLFYPFYIVIPIIQKNVYHLTLMLKKLPLV